MKIRKLRSRWLAAAVAVALPVAHVAAAEIPALDQPYPGSLNLAVDLSDAPKRLFRVRESIPVRPGPLVLYYPQWIPGDHTPSGPIDSVAGLIISANGARLPWRRDLRDMYALHLQVPQGATQLELAFQFLSPSDDSGSDASDSATPALVDLEFNQVLFYPAGYYASRIPVQSSVSLPAGWKFASALEVEGSSGTQTRFKPVSLEQLVDSPLIAGQYFNRVDLDPGAAVPVHLDVIADEADQVKLSDKQLAQHRALIQQAAKLFGAHHYGHYDFLLTLSEHTGHFGLEHHQSSDNRLPADFLDDDDTYLRDAGVLPHEYIHSWNGKFRRPANLWTPTYNTPMEDDLLWVYEGLTDYWCGVLSARAGMWTPAQYRDVLADIAAHMSYRSGRSWRSLQDTADAVPLTVSYGDGGWSNWRRTADYYPEGQLLWLDVDTQIRSLSGGKRSLDDFAKAFYGMDNGSFTPKTYCYEDVISTLNQIQPYDWSQFLRERLDYVGDSLPEHGIERSGWKLVYDDQPGALDKAGDAQGRGLNLAYSLGLTLSQGGSIRDVQWDGPAFRAGLVPGLSVIAVNGKDYSAETLKAAITAATKNQEPIALLVKNVDLYSTVKLDYHGGLKYAHLVRAQGKDLLGDIATPRK